jgi:hypothetical protein
VKVLLKGLCEAVSARAGSVQPSALAGSSTVHALSSLYKAPSGLLRRSKAATAEALVAALPAIQRGSKDETAKSMISLLDHFVSEIVEGQWGVEDAWGDRKTRGGLWGSLIKAAQAGNAALVSTVLQKAKTADVVTAASSAYLAGHSEVFDLLIEDERCLDTSGTPIVFCLLNGFSKPAIHGTSELTDDLMARRQCMIESFFRRWPHTATERWPHEDGRWCRPLEVAVLSYNRWLTRLVLDLSEKSLCFDDKDEVVDGRREITMSTLACALYCPCAEVMRMLVEAGLLVSEKYHPSVWGRLSQERMLTVACGFPLQARYEKEYKKMTKRRSHVLEVTDLLLAAPFPNFYEGRNVVLNVLFRGDGLLMEEDHAVAFLSKCKAAGMDIIHWEAEEVGAPQPFSLIHVLALPDHTKMVDFAIQVQGPESVDCWYTSAPAKESGKAEKHTALTAALRSKHLSTALHLLQRHKAKAVYREAGSDQLDQPLMCALWLGDDAAVLPVVQALIRRDPSLCDLECYRGFWR